MKGLSTLITFQALLSTISSIFISKMSFTGRMGISLFYKDYKILKVWWKTALLLFSIQLGIILILWIFKKIIGRSWASFLPGFIILVLSGVGAYWSYLDFTTTSHKYMRSNFHFGFYLFWASSMVSAFYFMIIKIKPKLLAKTEQS